MKREIYYIIAIVLGLIYILNGKFTLRKSTEEIKKDSIRIVKNTKELKGGFTDNKPTIIYVQTPKEQSNDVYLNTLLSELNTIKDASKKNEKILEALALRVYEKTYEDSTVVITVKDSINGRLKTQDVKWKVKPQKVSYFEKTITKKIKPNFRLLLGSKFTTNSTFEKSSIELNLGVQDKKGNIFEAGINTNNNISVGAKLNIFTKY